MLGEAKPLLQSAELSERVPPERAVDLHRHEGVALGEEPFPDRIERSRVREEEHLEGVRVGAQGLPDGLPRGPIRRAAVGADEVLRRRDQPLRPRKGEGEDPAVILVGVRVGEPPGAGPDRRVQDHARAEGVPGIGAAMREEHLPRSPRRQLTASVPDDADADDRDVQIISVDLGNAPDGPLRDAPLADDAVHTRDDLGAVRERHGPRVQLLEVAQAEIHPRREYW